MNSPYKKRPFLPIWPVAKQSRGKKGRDREYGQGWPSPQTRAAEKGWPSLSEIAVALPQVRRASRRPDAPERQATEYVRATHVAILSAWRFKTVRMDMRVHEFFYARARLGGHQNRKRDHPPG